MRAYDLESNSKNDMPKLFIGARNLEDNSQIIADEVSE